MYSKRFEKETFKNDVKENVRTLYRKEIEEATPQQIFQAVSYAVKEAIVDDWLATQKTYEKEDPKTVYYMSMEFLMGRALGNNLINMTAYKEVKEALDEMGIDLNVVEDQEPDAALGNGGLGRLAACFLDSLASLGYAAYGCGIRYRYGMFKQKIKDGYQVEVPDNWLKDGNPFEIRRDEYAKEVRFGGTIRVQYNEQTKKEDFIQENYESVLAIPYDMPIVGYGNHVVNTLRIWDAQAITDFKLDAFDRGEYHKAIEQENLAKTIARSYGLRFIEVLTGFKYIGQQILGFEQSGKGTYLFGFEESYGCLIGTHARDKDAIVATMALCEAAAYYKTQGKTLWDAMIDMYEKYGYYKDDIQAITLKGIEGLQKIQEIMETLRNETPSEIAGYKVLSARDYKKDTIKNMESGEMTKTGLPSSNVLYYDLSDEAWLCVRPSGTEPKVKFYYGVKGTSLEDADAKSAALGKQVVAMIQEML